MAHCVAHVVLDGTSGEDRNGQGGGGGARGFTAEDESVGEAGEAGGCSGDHLGAAPPGFGHRWWPPWERPCRHWAISGARMV